MSRFKTFDATGIAPGGVLFAGDLNAIQDRYADLSNFAQTVDVATLRLGDTSIQLVKYGTAESRLSSALRTDGILRGLGGLFAGQFTTAGRPGVGNRPYGLVIFNTDSNRYEVNIGTDAAPNWVQIALSADLISLPVGASFEYGGITDISASLVLEDGRKLDKTAYATLFGILSTRYNTGGEAANEFRIPDSRGRTAVGPDNMGTAQGDAARLSAGDAIGNSGGEEKHAQTVAEMAVHNHGGSTGTGTTGTDSPDHTHSGATGNSFNTGQQVIVATQSFLEPASGSPTNYIIQTLGSAQHSHSFTSGGRSAFHQHSVPALSISNQGSGTPANVMQPYVVKNKIIRII